MTSARPFDTASRVAKRWYTRIGSSELSTVTAEPRRMRSVRAGDGGEHDLRRGDGEVVAVVLADAEEVEAEPSASTASSTTLRMTSAWLRRRPSRVDGHVAEGVESQLDVAAAVVVVRVGVRSSCVHK